MARPASIPRGGAPADRFCVVLDEIAPGPPLCLALGNTRNWRNSANPVEHLNAKSL